MNPMVRAALPYLVGAAVLAVAFVGVRSYGGSEFDAGMKKAQADHKLAELAEFKNQTARLGRISDTLEGALAALRDAEPKIIERYTRVEVQSPLPAGCRIDAGRLQHINEASRLANSAGQSRQTLPSGARGDER